MFHRHPHKELTWDDTELALQPKLFYRKTRGEALLREIGVNRKHKATASNVNTAVRLTGSLPARIELLVLTCTIPQKGILRRAMVKPGVIEHLHTLYSHLSIHVNPFRECAVVIYLLPFVCLLW